MKKGINILPNAETSFKHGVYLGFFISFGLVFFIYPLDKEPLELFFLLIIGTGFIGIVFNLLIMLITSILLFLPLNLAAKYSKEQLFNLVMRSHLPLFLGIVFRILKVFNVGIPLNISFVALEFISIFFLIYNIRKFRQFQV